MSQGESLEDAVVQFVHTMSDRETQLLQKATLHKEFGAEKLQDFMKEWKKGEANLEKIPTSKKVEKAIDTIKPLAAKYLKDLNRAKILLAEVFDKADVGLDSKDIHEELKNKTMNEIYLMEMAMSVTMERLQNYYWQRNALTVESKLNPKCEDLQMATWCWDNQAAVLAQSKLYHMAQGYQSITSILQSSFLRLHGLHD